MFFSCKNNIDASDEEDERDENVQEIELELKGDRYVDIDDDILSLKKGTKWKQIKDEINRHLNFEEGYTLNKWKLGSSSRGKNLSENYTFKKSASIYATSKKKKQHKDISPEEPPESPEVPSEENPQPEESEEPSPYAPAISQSETIADDEMIEALHSSVQIIAPAIEYPLPAFPLPSKEELWQGIFSNDRIIELHPFKLGKYEVVYRLWKEIYDWAIERGYKFLNVGSCGSKNEGGMRQPIVMVSWCDVIVWCNAYTEKMMSSDSCVYLNNVDESPIKDATDEKLSRNITIDLSKKGFRLPLESEWEYAARCESKKSPNTVEIASLYFSKLNSASGATLPIACRNSELKTFRAMNAELKKTTVCQWYFNGAKYERFKPYVFSTMPCASKRANHLGFYDMSGNVEEMCTLFTTEEVFEKDFEDIAFCVARGGSWESFSYNCTVGKRQCRAINEKRASLGFRLCQTK